MHLNGASTIVTNRLLLRVLMQCETVQVSTRRGAHMTDYGAARTLFHRHGLATTAIRGATHSISNSARMLLLACVWLLQTCGHLF